MSAGRVGRRSISSLLSLGCPTHQARATVGCFTSSRSASGREASGSPIRMRYTCCVYPSERDSAPRSVYNQAMSETCKAAWSGGKCDRAPEAARGLCQGHYAQWRRQTRAGTPEERVKYEPLRLVGEGGAATVPVTVHLPHEVAADYKRAAKEADKGVSELLRPWLADGYKRHQAALARRKRPTG